jgi:diguanylate cyclase (GGDEF)-like protein/PAS domain S-box-containing protein
MGLAISGMHYTGMQAAEFRIGHGAAAPSGPAIETSALAIALVLAFSVLLLLGLITAFFDRKLATLTAQEALALQQSEERLRALYRNASDIVAVLDENGVLTYEASSALPILGFRTDEMVGKSLLDFLPPSEVEQGRAFIRLLLNESQGNVELRASHADGTARDFEVIGKNLLHDPAVNGLVVNLRDITDRKRLMAELERLSETDALTRTLNRRGFLKLAEREHHRAQRAGRPLALVMIDIDYFKGVNDTFGHAAGDMVLATVAETSREHLRSVDLIARFGGEEFLILLADTPLDAAHEVVTRLHRAVAACRIPTIKGEVSVTASFGLALVDANAIDLETGIRLADEALYDAKRSGRNCIKILAAAA